MFGEKSKFKIMKTVQQAMKEGNEGKNQDIKRKFVNQHVHANITSMVEYILSKNDANAPFEDDDIENLFTLPEWNGSGLGKDFCFGGGTDEERETFIEDVLRAEIEESLCMYENKVISEATHERNSLEIEDLIKEVEDLESETKDVYEWWQVSTYLAEKLRKLGHPVITGDDIWGRCTTGQAILLDHTITIICAEMEILEGQKYDWSK
jgi:hypothetical protein